MAQSPQNPGDPEQDARDDALKAVFSAALSGVAPAQEATMSGEAIQWAHTVSRMEPREIYARTGGMDQRGPQLSSDDRRMRLLSQVPGARQAYDRLQAASGSASGTGAATTSERPVTGSRVESKESGGINKR